jgi:hypothetical protein
MFNFSRFGLSAILRLANLREEKKEAPCWSKALSRAVGKLKSIE